MTGPGGRHCPFPDRPRELTPDAPEGELAPQPAPPPAPELAPEPAPPPAPEPPRLVNAPGTEVPAIRVELAGGHIFYGLLPLIPTRQALLAEYGKAHAERDGVSTGFVALAVLGTVWYSGGGLPDLAAAGTLRSAKWDAVVYGERVCDAFMRQGWGTRTRMAELRLRGVQVLTIFGESIPADGDVEEARGNSDAPKTGQAPSTG